MNARHGCWTIPQWLLDLEDRVKELEDSYVTLYEHNIDMLVSSDSTPVAAPKFTVYNSSAKPFTSETILVYLLLAKTKSVSGIFGNKGISHIIYIAGGGYRVTFDDGTAVAFNNVTSINDVVLPIGLHIQE